MNRRDAAPGARHGPGCGLASSKGYADSIAPDLIPARIVARLADAGVRSVADWRALGRRRMEIFGITRRWIDALDELARERR